MILIVETFYNQWLLLGDRLHSGMSLLACQKSEPHFIQQLEDGWH